MNGTANFGAPPAHRDRLSLAAAVLVWTLILLMIVPDGFDYRMLVAGETPAAGSLMSRLLWLALLAGSLMLIFLRGSLAWVLLRHINPFLLLFAALVLASIAWSIEPSITLRRDIRFLTIGLVCIAFALAGWHPRRLQAVVRPILTLMLFGSLVFGVLAPDLAIHREASAELVGAWRGLTNHKNSLGALASVTLLIWLHGWMARDVRAMRAISGGAIALSALLLSRSATALIATLFGALFLCLLARWPRALQPYLKIAIAGVLTALTLYALAILQLIPGQGLLLAPITMATGFDTTFTGRSEIWVIVGEHIRQHPLLGVGYGAYWVGPDPQSPSYAFITRMQGFYPGSAHNGYLEIANDLGWTGLLCLVAYMVTHLRQALHAMGVDKPQAALYLTLFMHQVIANLSESHWLSVLSVHFVLMTLITTALARLLLDYRLQRYAHRPQTASAKQVEPLPADIARALQLQGRRL